MLAGALVSGRRCWRALALRGDGPAPGVPLVPTPPRRVGRRAPIPDPFAYDPDDEDALVAPRRRRHEPRPLRALARRRDADRGAGRALAPAGRGGRARARGVAPDMLEGARLPRERRPRGRDGGRHRGRRRAHADPRRDGPEPARHARRRRAQRAARRAGSPARYAAGRATTSSALRAPAPRRSTSASTRPKALAGTARYLTIAKRELGPRGPRVRLVPHGDRQPPGRAARLRGERAPSYAPALLRLDAGPATPTCSASSRAFGDDSSNYLWKLYAAREIMRLYRERPGRAARGSRRCRRRKNSAEEVLHPPDDDAALRARPPRSRRRGTTATIRAFPDEPALTGLRARPRAWASWPSGSAPPPGALPRAAARGARDGALHRRRRCASTRAATRR